MRFPRKGQMTCKPGYDARRGARRHIAYRPGSGPKLLAAGDVCLQRLGFEFRVGDAPFHDVTD